MQGNPLPTPGQPLANHSPTPLSKLLFLWAPITRLETLDRRNVRFQIENPRSETRVFKTQGLFEAKHFGLLLFSCVLRPRMSTSKQWNTVKCGHRLRLGCVLKTQRFNNAVWTI